MPAPDRSPLPRRRYAAPVRRRTVLVVAIAVGVLVAAGIVAAVVISTGGSSASPTASAPRPVAASTAPATTTSAADPGVPATGQKVVSRECPPVHGPRWSYPGGIEMSSSTYESFATGYGCSDAAKWTTELSGRTLKDKRVGMPSPLTGVPGFTCSGYPDRFGHAYAGVCRKGTSAVTFGWNINVLHGPREQVLNAEDVSRQELGGADASTILRQTGTNTYVLDVVNTSGIGYIDHFSWTAPEGWKITGVTSADGGQCKVSGARTIACSGRLRPPKCLCTQSGGAVSIAFSAKAKSYSIENGIRVYHAAVGGVLKVDRMTPVPYLVPATRAAAAHHGNL